MKYLRDAEGFGVGLLEILDRGNFEVRALGKVGRGAVGRLSVSGAECFLALREGADGVSISSDLNTFFNNDANISNLSLIYKFFIIKIFFATLRTQAVVVWQFMVEAVGLTSGLWEDL